MKRTAFFIARSCHLRGNSKRRLSSLTEANLKLSAKISVGMALGFVEEAPLLMIYEYEPGRQKVIDLSSEKRKYSVRNLVETFQELSQYEIPLNPEMLQVA